jgi:hypothetical protein
MAVDSLPIHLGAIPMRSASIFALILVAAVAVGLALNHRQLPARLPDLENIENDVPIQQDTARMEKRRREWLDWNRRTLSGAYDKVGKRDPKWDKLAHEALEHAARMFSLQLDPPVRMVDIYEPSKAAVDAGCDDPLVVYLVNRSAQGKNYPGLEEIIKRMKASGKALQASQYPAIRRAIALELAGTHALNVKNPSDAVKNEAEAFFDASLALLTEAVKSDERNEFWRERWFTTINDLVRGYRTIGMEAPAAYQRVDDQLGKVPELKALRLQFRGNFWFHYGWEARTQAFAPAVSASGFASLEERLDVAKQALEEAWKLAPDDGRTAETLMEIDKAVGGDRATMELWFDRAIKAEGDRRDACWSKLDWLDPKWHGTPDEILAFGRRCRDTKNWWAGITLLCADAHTRYANLLGNQKADYLASPEVWSDITSVYDVYLNHHPQDHVARSKYASLAYDSRHYQKAHTLFQRLGNNLTSWTEFPYYPLETLKSFRDFSAKVAAKAKAAKP